MDNIIQNCIKNRKVLDALIKYPDREFTINELSKITKIPYATCWRFMRQLDKTGIIFCKKIGHSFSCKLNTSSPMTAEVRKLLEIKTSPQVAVLDDFVGSAIKLKAVEKVILFGSVARSEQKLTSDVDIAIIVKKKSEKSEREITSIADEITSKSRVVIVPLILTLKELSENNQFSSELKKGKELYVRHKGS